MEIKIETPPMPTEFQSQEPPHAFGIPVSRTPPCLRKFQDATRGKVQIFSGITQCLIKGGGGELIYVSYIVVNPHPTPQMIDDVVLELF